MWNRTRVGNEKTISNRPKIPIYLPYFLIEKKNYPWVPPALETELAFLFGPGEAKGELEKRLELAHYKGRVVGVEPADHMTDPQIVAKVREHYFDQLEAKYLAASSE